MAKKAVRQLWTDALKGGSLKKSNNIFCQCSRGCSGIILGIDPSLRGTGIAVLESRGGNLKFIFSKKISLAPRFSFYECLGKIFGEICEIVGKYHPNHAAMECPIFVQNHRIAQTLGSVRGAIIAALTGKGIEIYEYPPLRIKQAVTGIGRASKEQVMATVRGILKVENEISSDESDALAAACCHAWTFVQK